MKILHRHLACARRNNLSVARSASLSSRDFTNYKTVSGIGISSAETEPAAPVICIELEIKPVLAESSHVPALSLYATPSG